MPSTTISALPFEDIRALLGQLPEGDQLALQTVQARNQLLNKPVGSLGRLETLCEWLAHWSGKSPQVNRPLVAIFAGTHRIAERLDGEDNANAVLVAVSNLTAGGAAVNQACAVQDAGLKIYDLALQVPVADIGNEPALDERGCAATIAFGMEAVAGGSDLLVLSDTGVGNDVASAALLAALWGGEADMWVTKGAGESDERLSRRLDLVKQALETHKGHLDDPLEALRRLGGREHAGLAGAILAARVQKVPVILDGVASLAAASVIARLEPSAIAHCLLANRAKAGVSARVAEKLELDHICDLGITLGQGVAGATAIGIVKTAAQIHNEMATTNR